MFQEWTTNDETMSSGIIKIITRWRLRLQTDAAEMLVRLIELI